MGILLALLLGVAAAFFVLAMPIRMLESVTTFTHLSKLMVQAEPPISPNDRTLLSVLAGILTTGIGWVLVDWLMFGRAGISTLIRAREDDYEDEDEDHFRPTDPLDLVTPAGAQTADWPMPSSGDARKPLSARTDIGDPPVPANPFAAQPSAISQALPPINDILLGAGTIAPPLQPNALPPLVQPSTVAPSPAFGLQPGAGGQGAPPSWPPLDLPAEAVAEALIPIPAAQRPSAPLTEALQSPAGLPSWMPAPGARPDGQASDPLPAAFFEELAEPALPEAEPVADPDPAMPMMQSPLIMPVDPLPPLPMSQEAFSPPLAPPPFEVAPPAPVMPEPQQPAPMAEPPVVATQPVAAPPIAVPVAPGSAAPPVAAPRSLPESGFDRGQLEDLLVRLERGLQQRRAAVAARAPQPAPVVAPMPEAPAPVAVAPVMQPASLPVYEAREAPPAAFAAPPPLIEPVAPPPPIMVDAPPAAVAPSPYALGIEPPPSAPTPSILPMPPAPILSEGRNDEMLDQPLHVTLDLLRSMVKR